MKNLKFRKFEKNKIREKNWEKKKNRSSYIIRKMRKNHYIVFYVDDHDLEMLGK
jgi:hypothetical protein